MRIPVFCSCMLLSFFVGCQPDSTATTQPAAGEAKIEAQKAAVGVAKQGQSLQDRQGVAKIVAAPLSAVAGVKQMVAYDIQVKQALDVFQAQEGRLPRSHEEFMEKCIRANNIQLPELPEGAVYRFNVEKGELWVYPQEDLPEN